MITARKNLSVAKGEQNAAMAVLTEARNQAAEAVADARKQASARRQTVLLKRADEATTKASALQEQMRAEQSVVPPAGMSMQEHVNWSMGHASRLQQLAAAINQASQDAAQ